MSSDRLATHIFFYTRYLDPQDLLYILYFLSLERLTPTLQDPKGRPVPTPLPKCGSPMGSPLGIRSHPLPKWPMGPPWEYGPTPTNWPMPPWEYGPTLRLHRIFDSASSNEYFRTFDVVERISNIRRYVFLYFYLQLYAIFIALFCPHLTMFSPPFYPIWSNFYLLILPLKMVPPPHMVGVLVHSAIEP